MTYRIEYVVRDRYGYIEADSFNEYAEALACGLSRIEDLRTFTIEKRYVQHDASVGQ